MRIPLLQLVRPHCLFVLLVLLQILVVTTTTTTTTSTTTTRLVAAATAAAAVATTTSTVVGAAAAATNKEDYQVGQIPLGIPVRITTSTFPIALQDSANPLWIFKFFAPWCGHCKRLIPVRFFCSLRNVVTYVSLASVYVCVIYLLDDFFFLNNEKTKNKQTQKYKNKQTTNQI